MEDRKQGLRVGGVDVIALFEGLAVSPVPKELEGGLFVGFKVESGEKGGVASVWREADRLVFEALKDGEDSTGAAVLSDALGEELVREEKARVDIEDRELGAGAKDKAAVAVREDRDELAKELNPQSLAKLGFIDGSHLK